ncbi:MAG TPA: hypothetical protein VGH20_13305 [Myxococcales bacterium]
MNLSGESRVPAWSLLALRVGMAGILGLGAVHALLRRQSLVIALAELCGCTLLLFRAREGAVLLGLSLVSAMVWHRNIPQHFVIPAAALIVIGMARR